MTARGLEDLDGGLGSCLPSDDFSLLEEPSSGRRPDGKAQGASRLADSCRWTPVLQDTVTAGTVEKELVAQEGLGTSKGIPKAGTSPRSVPARRKLQAAPPLKPPPPPPPPRDDLPWGDLTLNKCLVLASLVALLGSAVQLCQDAVAGEVAVEIPQQWVPPSPTPKKPEAPAPKPPLLVPPSGPPEPKPEPPGPQVQKQEKPEAAEAETQGEPGGSTPEASGEECAPLGGQGSQERPREKSKKREKLKKEKLRREKPRKEERPWVTREPRQSLSRRWEAREGGHRPWMRSSRELEHEKRQAWASRRRHDRDDRPRQKPRVGKGRD
ncbi:junctional sarcoplasmic reticulum protein 1 [Chionomys nivalis]|uniref:junctional sarcoplasmic reticulum protein 1 n=1 Tax=Chionomys nivalis TaxID=269649 RepID=UPI002591398E|nr:junctional sarcoplasmic reticulum protein 1 [Chionomys nivalis]